MIYGQEVELMDIPVGSRFVFKDRVYKRVSMRLVNIASMKFQSFALDIKTNEVTSFFWREKVYKIQ